MSTADRAVPPSAFLRRSVRAAVESALLLPLVTVVTLVPLAVSGTRFAPFAVATYVGLVLSVAGNAGRVDPPRLGEIDEPRAVTVVRSLVIVLYFNAVIVVGTGVGETLATVGYGQVAYAAAVLVPAVDATLARFQLPSLGLAGGFVVTSVAVGARLLGRVAPDSEYLIAAAEVSGTFDSLDALYDGLQHRFDQAVGAWG